MDDAIRAGFRQDFASVPDSTVEIEQMVAEDDKVALRAIYRET